MAYKFIKYLDPETKQYRDDVTIRAVGDLDKLQTTVKTTIVDAINSLLNGNFQPNHGEIPSNVAEKIIEIQDKINNLFKNGGMTAEQLADFGLLISKEIQDDINKKSEEDKKKYQELLDKTVAEYKAKVQEVNVQIASYENSVNQAKEDLKNIRKEMADAHEDYVKVTQDVNEIDGKIKQKVDYSVFDLMNATLKKGDSNFIQSKETIELMAREKGLDFSDSEVYEALAHLRVLSGRIDSKVSLTEVNEEIAKIDTETANLLRYSRNLSRGWNPSNAHAILGTESYRNTKVFETTSDTGYYTTTLDGLTVGKSYTASIYAKVKNPNPNIRVKFHHENKSLEMGETQEDTSIINGWKRVYVNFVAEKETEQVSFRFTNLGNNNVGYLCAPKVDRGLKPKNWQPHIDDDYEELKIQGTNITQTANEITQLANAITQNGNNITSENASIRNAANAIKLQAERVQKIDDNINKANAEITINSDAIKNKVWKDDIDNKIGDIDLDTKNRILNSDFKREFENWKNTSNQFRIVEINGVKYATAKREGLTADNVITLESDFIQATNGERLMFSFDFITKSLSKLDNKTIFAIELYNISDTRVFRKNYTIQELNGEVTDDKLTRLNGAYVIDREDVAKVKIRLMLTRNGEVFFSRISLQHGSINNTLWNAAPEDSQLIIAKMETSIIQEAKKISLNAVEEAVNPINEVVKRNEAGITVASDLLKAFIVDERGRPQEITANKDGLYIDFDKVYVSKEMLANKLTAISLDVAKGFRVMNGDKVVLGANSDGEVVMNVSKLQINANDVATKKDVSKTEERIVQSNSDNLLYNGFLTTKDDTNFKMKYKRTVFDGETNINGYPSLKSSAPDEVFSEELIPVDINYPYEFSYYIKTNSQNKVRHYGGLVCYDIDKQIVEANHVMFMMGTTTQLARPLKPGDSKVYLKSLASWADSPYYYRRRLIFWNYVDSTGYQWPKETYSRNLLTNIWSENKNALNAEENSITLAAPYNGVEIPADTWVSQGNSGGYLYCTAAARLIGTEPMFLSGVVSGVDTSGSRPNNKFPPATKYISTVFLNNYQGTATDITWVSNMSIRKVTTAEKSLDEFKENVNTKLDSKADLSFTEEQLNRLKEEQNLLSVELQARASLDTVRDFIKQYQDYVAQAQKDKSASEKALIEQAAKIIGIAEELGNMQRRTNFIDNYLSSSEEGLVFGAKDGSATVRMAKDRISMYSSGQEVMYITQGVMYINNGIFAKSIQIGRYREEQYSLNLDMNVIRYVGGA